MLIELNDHKSKQKIVLNPYAAKAMYNHSPWKDVLLLSYARMHKLLWTPS